MRNLSIKQIYQGREFLPWKIDKRNDFLKIEKKLLSENFIWYDKFINSEQGKKLDDVRYYVLPTKVDSKTKINIAIREEDFDIITLSAMNTSIQLPVLMVFPSDKKPPREGSLIEITAPTKLYLEKMGTTIIDKGAIYVENFKEVPRYNLYGELVDEKRSVLKFIKENLIKTDDSIAKTFQTTISSSPYFENKGGIALSSYNKKYHGEEAAFVDEFIKTLKLIQPPEFSDIKNFYPVSLLKGKWEKYPPFPGISYHLSEKIIPTSYYFSAFSSSDLRLLTFELSKRKLFGGEYSIFGNINDFKGTYSRDRSMDVLSKFVKTESFNDFDINSLENVDLIKTQHSIDENLMGNIVIQRKSNPLINREEFTRNLIKTLPSDWDVILESLNLHRKTSRLKNVYVRKTVDNIIRIAKSIARDKGKLEVDDIILNEAHNLFLKNYQALISSEPLKYQTEKIIPEMVEDEKFNAVRAELSTEVLSLKQLFENVWDLFDNSIMKLQSYLDGLIREGNVWEPRLNYYAWMVT